MGLLLYASGVGGVRVRRVGGVRVRACAQYQYQ